MIKAPTAQVSTVVHNTDWFRGKTVRVAGEVETVHNPRAFTMEGDAILWEHDITVITKTPVEFVGIGIDDDDEVMVTGRVAEGTAEVERELGRKLEPEVAREVGSKPVLIARTIRLVGEYASWSLADSHPATIGLLSLLTHPDPERLVGQRVAIRAAEIRWVGERSMRVGAQRSKQVLVVPTGPLMIDALRPGMTVAIAGTAEKLPSSADAKRTHRFALDPDAHRGIENQRLYIAASSIEPTSQPTAMR